MSIKKMLLLGTMAMAAIAFAAPAVAQADVFLSDEDNIPLDPGADVTATSTNLITTTTGGTLSCAKVTLHFDVKTNNGTHVELTPTGQATTENCIVVQNGFKVTITDGTVLGDVTINTWGTANAAMTFNDDVYHSSDINHTTILQQCHFAGTAHLVGLGTTKDEIELTPSSLTGTGAGCAATGTIEGKFTLETEDKTPVLLHYKQT